METEELFQLQNGKYIMDDFCSEVMYKLKSIKPESAQDTSTGYEWNDYGMAEIFSELYAEKARYCEQDSSWYVYDKGRWAADACELRVAELIKDFVRLMVLYCGEILDDELRSNYLKFIDRMGDRRMRLRIQQDARSRMMIKAEEFDTNPYLINCLNGTFDLETMTFRQHDPHDLITMQTKFDYSMQPEVNHRWEQFIADITNGNAQKAKYLQKALGYSLLGLANEECMFILYGKTTRNGKSTLLNTIQEMLGDYSTTVPVELISKTRYTRDANEASPEVVKLKGKRFVTTAESDESCRMDEAKIKQFTGGEELSARALRKAPITFTPQFTLWLSCNDLPTIRDQSMFASNRIRLIEFNRHFTAEEQDITLKRRLLLPESMKGIFRWMVEGYKLYRDEGLKMCDEMQQIVNLYAKDSDIVLQFLEASCTKDETAEAVKAKQLYDRFKLWCTSNEIKPVTMKRFNAEMDKHPEWTESVSRNNLKWYKGLKLTISI